MIPAVAARYAIDESGRAFNEEWKESSISTGFEPARFIEMPHLRLGVGNVKGELLAACLLGERTTMHHQPPPCSLPPRPLLDRQRIHIPRSHSSSRRAPGKIVLHDAAAYRRPKRAPQSQAAAINLQGWAAWRFVYFLALRARQAEDRDANNFFVHTRSQDLAEGKRALPVQLGKKRGYLRLPQAVLRAKQRPKGACQHTRNGIDIVRFRVTNKNLRLQAFRRLWTKPAIEGRAAARRTLHLRGWRPGSS